MLWTSIFAVVSGFALLVWGADRFVTGAAATARNLGISPLIIGLTVVGFGTSAPEILVSAVAAWSGNPHIGIGNAIGSNITNIGLVLGCTAIVAPLHVRSKTIRREFPLLFVIMLVALILLYDGAMQRYDGVILIVGMVGLIYWMVLLGLRQQHLDSDPIDAEFSDEIPNDMPSSKALFWLFLGLAILLGSSHILVWGSVNIAQWFGISDLVIGLTIIAIGTSLPELAASVISAIRGEHDIALGNVLGSNMFNLLAVLGMPGLIRPGSTPVELLSRDFPFMIGLAVALFIMGYGLRDSGKIGRFNGVLLLCGYLIYMWMLYYSSNG